MHATRSNPGTIESAVRGHYPTQAVLYEACALDRELGYDPPCWDALLRAIESFTTHYPAVLLRSPAAMTELGQACLDGIHRSPGLALKVRSANLLVDMLRGVMNEVSREGSDRVTGSIPQVVNSLLCKLLEDQTWMTQLISLNQSQLVPPLLALGKQVLLVMSEGTSPDAWNLLVRTLTRLLIKLIRYRVKGEPCYDGRWDQGEASGQLAVALLEPVRKEYIDRDIKWLADLEHTLEEGTKSEVDVFFELSTYTNREEREQAWEAWFGVLAATASSGGLSVETLRDLCEAVAEWISNIQDRRFLSKLTAILKHTATTLVKSSQRIGLEIALETLGQAVVKRLEAEAGRGDIDLTSSNLRAVVAKLVESYLDQVEKTPQKKIVDLGLRNCTGPLSGHPVSRDDVIWRMRMAVEHPEVAEPFLLSLISGFALEELVLQEEASIIPGQATLSQALGSMLGRSWQRDLLHLVRAVVRIIPLSPLHLGNTSALAHLMALDPEHRSGSYLHDLKERVLAGTGKENLVWLESVLWFWLTGKPECLDNLACPESLTSLPGEVERQRVDHIKQMILSLRQHAPVSGIEKKGVEWLGHMPESYYDTNTLLKVAGFPGCSSRSVALLFHLLNIYRHMVVKFRDQQGSVCIEKKPIQELLQHSDELLLQRKDLADRLFAPEGLKGLEPTERLELFKRDLSLVMKVDGVLAQLAWRCRQETGNSRLEQGAKIVSRMLANASVSGLGSKRLDSLIKRCLREPLSSDRLEQLSKQMLSLRNDLVRRLRPHVLDSVRRLLENHLSRSTSSYSHLINSSRYKNTKDLAEEVGRLLANDLLSTDGGLLSIENFVRYLKSSSGQKTSSA